jgi:hypothetical protein
MARTLLAVAVAIFLCACNDSTGMVDDPRDRQFEPKDFLIIRDVKGYKQAVTVMHKAAGLLGLPETDTWVDGRTKKRPTAEGVLSLPERVCKKNGWSHPCNVSRGRWDAGAYLSIEQRGFWDHTIPGEYSIVAASGERGEKLVAAWHAIVEDDYPDARIDTLNVYMGCMH